MTKSQLEKLYKVACEGKGFKPTDGQFKVWQLTLGHLEEADLAQALVFYFTDSSMFPMPAELRPLAERARRERTALSQVAKEFYLLFECPDCGGTTSGFFPEGPAPELRCRSPYTPIRDRTKGEPISLPRGQICGGKLVMVQCEDTQVWKDERAEREGRKKQSAA